MNFLRDYTFTWWQAALFKLYLLSAGLIIGGYFYEYVMRWMTGIIVVFVLLLIYFTYAWVKGDI